MKKLICLCVVILLLGGCVTSVVTEKTQKETPPDVPSETQKETPPDVPSETPAETSQESASPHTGYPIPVLKDISVGDVSAIEQVTMGSSLPLDERLFESTLEMLKLIELTSKPDENVKIEPTVKFALTLVSGDVISLAFADNYVDYGEGAYLFDSADKTPFQPGIVQISLFFDDDSIRYEEESDITALQDLLQLTPCGEAVPFNEEDVVLNIFIFTKAQRGQTYKVQRTADAIYMYKRFFTMQSFLGTISEDAYAKLALALKGQFVPLYHLSVTSGGETIYPEAHLVSKLIYDTASGKAGVGYGVHPIEDYLDTLETLTLAADFSMWMKPADSTSFKLLRDGKTVREGSALSYRAFDGLIPGTYQVEFYRTNEGDYIPKLGKPGWWTDVYYFQVAIN